MFWGLLRCKGCEHMLPRSLWYRQCHQSLNSEQRYVMSLTLHDTVVCIIVCGTRMECNGLDPGFPGLPDQQALCAAENAHSSFPFNMCMGVWMQTVQCRSRTATGKQQRLCGRQVDRCNHKRTQRACPCWTGLCCHCGTSNLLECHTS